jgi:deoxyribonuclease-4
MNKSSKPLLGAHLSVAGGLHNAIHLAQELDCTAVQIFTHSNRQWAFKLPTLEAAQEFINAQKASSVQTVVVHASYLMNPASPEESSRKKAVHMLKMELEACALLKIPYLVLHPGSRLDSELKTALSNCAQTINQALAQDDTGSTKILIENMAGQGSVIGSTLEELQEIYHHITHKDRVGFCFDTCHAFAAGYDFATTQEAYVAFWKKFDALLGREKLHVIHVNDSLKPLGSRVDRHTDIGKGKIAVDAFSYIMNDDEFRKVAKIIETPKGLGLEEDKKNLDLLRSLIKR